MKITSVIELTSPHEEMTAECWVLHVGANGSPPADCWRTQVPVPSGPLAVQMQEARVSVAVWHERDLWEWGNVNFIGRKKL